MTTLFFLPDSRIAASQARSVYPALLVGTVLVCNLVPLSIGYLVANITFFTILFSLTLRYARPSQWLADRIASEQASRLAPSSASPDEALISQAPRERVSYIDDLRAALTVAVVLHHCTGAVNGGSSLGLSIGAFRNPLQVVTTWFLILQQSYFMSLFFFISALLVPQSLARKGRTAFLADRFKRIGVPLMIYSLVAGPALGLIGAAFAGAPLVYTGPNPNVAWYLAWLLMFTTAYTAIPIDGEGAPGEPVPRPSLAVLAGAGAVLGALQFVQLAFLPAFISMPISFGSLPFDAAAFWAGTAAAHGRWLVAPFAERDVAIARGAVVAIAAGLLALLGSIYASGGGYYLLAYNACGVDPAVTAMPGADAVLTILGQLFVLCVVLGVFALCVSVALLDFFQRNAATPGPWRKWIANVSFAAYLVHPLAVLPLTAALARASGVALRWSEKSPVDAISCMSMAVLGGGFVGLVAVALPLTYAAATLLKMIPVIRDFL